MEGCKRLMAEIMSKMDNENWYKLDCKDCDYFISTSSFGFVEAKECLLSPLKKCPHEDNEIGKLCLKD